MKNFAILIPILILSLGSTATAKAGPFSPSISSADLDTYIDSLPTISTIDPVNTLRARLLDLDRQNSTNKESQALQEALGLISLARSIRISSESQDDSPTLLAGL